MKNRFMVLSLLALVLCLGALILPGCENPTQITAGTSIDTISTYSSTRSADSTFSNSSSTSSSYSDTGTYVGSITGRVFSAANGQIMAGVSVVLTGYVEGDSGASRTMVTDVNGYYQFKNLNIGDYLLTIQPITGYSGKREQVQVVVPAGHSAIGPNTDLQISVKKDFDLLPLTANVTGSVFANKEKALAKVAGNSFGAASAIVEIYVKDQIPDRYLDTTSATGVYSFTNVPATALRNINAAVIVQPYRDADGTQFAGQTDSVKLLSGSNPLTTVYLATYQEPFVLLRSNIAAVDQNSVALNASFLLVMSSNIDDSRLGDVKLEEVSGPTRIPVTIDVGSDTATVDPTVTLTAGTNYRLIFKLFSEDGRSSTLDTLEFSTVKGIEITSINFYATDMTTQRLAVNSSIVIGFSMAPVIGAETQITLTDALGQVQCATSISGSTLTITPSNNLKSNTNYTVTIANLKSAITADDLDFSDSFTTQYTAAPAVAVTGLALQDASFKANYNTLAVPVKWNRSSDASTYNVYVKNNAHPAWLLLSANADVGDNFSSVQRQSVNLNSAELDMIVNGVSIEPFALAAKCSLKVVPVNADGIEGAAATQMSMGIGDLVQPQIYNNVLFTTKADVNMNNISGTSQSIEITVEFTEYMNTSATPTLAIVGGGFSTVTFTNWAWGATEGSMGKNIATFTMTIPNTINLNTEEVSISNIADQSGNSIATDVVITLTDL